MPESEPNPLPAPARLVLAHEEPFELRGLNVSPAHRQLDYGGRSETLEPRVMQVFVALARAGGRILTRDDFTELCWDGRIVGEDAINRTLSRLRHVLSDLGARHVAIETITKVGYRLIDLGGGGANHSAATRNAASIPTDNLSRRALVASIAGISAAGAGILYWQLSPRPAPPPTPAAVQLYQQAIQNRGQNSLQQAEQSVAYLREATRIDPHFTQAWGALAWGYRALLEYGPRLDSGRVAILARSAAARALDADPDNVEARAALLLLSPIYGRWAEVQKGCRTLLTRHPGNSILQYNLGHTLCESGQLRTAIPILTEAASREPFWPLLALGLFHALLASGRVEEADALLADASTRWPHRREFWLATHLNLLTSDRVGEATAFAADLSRRPINSEPAVALALSIEDAMANRSASAGSRAVARIGQVVRTDTSLLMYAATAACILDRTDVAFDLLDGLYFGEGAWAAAYSDRPRTGPLFTSWTKALRGDSRFEVLLRRTGLRQYWSLAKIIPDFRRYGQSRQVLPLRLNFLKTPVKLRRHPLNHRRIIGESSGRRPRALSAQRANLPSRLKRRATCSPRYFYLWQLCRLPHSASRCAT